MKYRAPIPLSIHQITCGLAQPQSYIDQLLLYFEYFQCGISLEHKFALNRDHCAIFSILLQPDDVPMSLIDNEVPSKPTATSTRHFGWFKRYQHFLFPTAGIAIALLAIY